MARTPVAIAWFRRDLRLDDNAALLAALAAATPAGQVVPLFVRDPAILASGRVGRHRGERLDAAIAALDLELRARGGRLVIRTGPPDEALPALVRETGAREVHASRDCTPYARRRDRAVAAALGPGVPLRLHAGTLLVEPESIGERRVFTPFHRAWLAALGRPWGPADQAGRVLPGDPVGRAAPTGASDAVGIVDVPAVRAPLRAPERVLVPSSVVSEPAPGIAPRGEAAARELLAAFAGRADRYARERDLLDGGAGSGLSADLHLGAISPRRVLEAVTEPSFVRQLAWRDWAAHRAWFEPFGGRDARRGHDPGWSRDPAWSHDPARSHEPAWSHDPERLAAWAEGRTGYPAVDAAMRQLAETGWISNRARMVAASFLAKDLLLDWRLGLDWFERTLVDADVASNALNWRWVAGDGPDASPWFRIMNPVLQGERFDPVGAWVRRWVPEMRAVPDAFAHRPWDAPAGPPHAYPPRIVDHVQARARALALGRPRGDGVR